MPTPAIIVETRDMLAPQDALGQLRRHDLVHVSPQRSSAIRLQFVATSVHDSRSCVVTRDDSQAVLLRS